MPKNNYNTIDLCAGIGGIRRGYELAGCFKAIPHNYFRAIATSDFSSDETKSTINTVCINEHFCEI